MIRTTEPQDRPCYAYVQRDKGGKMWHVAQLPGQGGVDWGYGDSTSVLDKPIPLSTYWQRRFRADQLRCSRTAFFQSVESPNETTG